MELEIDPDEEEKDDINIDDERERHWRNVFEDNVFPEIALTTPVNSILILLVLPTLTYSSNSPIFALTAVPTMTTSKSIVSSQGSLPKERISRGRGNKIVMGTAVKAKIGELEEEVRVGS